VAAAHGFVKTAATNCRPGAAEKRGHDFSAPRLSGPKCIKNGTNFGLSFRASPSQAHPYRSLCRRPSLAGAEHLGNFEKHQELYFIDLIPKLPNFGPTCQNLSPMNPPCLAAPSLAAPRFPFLPFDALLASATVRQTMLGNNITN
jgi:hypothetical protein